MYYFVDKPFIVGQLILEITWQACRQAEISKVECIKSIKGGRENIIEASLEFSWKAVGSIYNSCKCKQVEQGFL